MIFGVMSLLIALAIIGMLGKKQLQALGQVGNTGAPAPATAGGTVPVQAQAIQNNVRDATHAALQKGVERSNGAQP